MAKMNQPQQKQPGQLQPTSASGAPAQRTMGMPPARSGFGAMMMPQNQAATPTSAQMATAPMGGVGLAMNPRMKLGGPAGMGMGR